jgi:acetyltransferase-like isoleucine patch superfamily enzyme
MLSRSAIASRLGHGWRLIALQAISGMFWLPHGARVFLYRRCGMTIGHHVGIVPGAFIRPGAVTIGSGSFINAGCVIDPGDARIEIGTRVAIGPRVVLAGNTHRIGSASSRAGDSCSADIHVGDGCWLGAGVIVLAGVTIAPGCVVGAGAVVTKDTARDGVYVGAPARRMRALPAGRPDALEEPVKATR